LPNNKEDWPFLPSVPKVTENGKREEEFDFHSASGGVGGEQRTG
jgi:hypothetical protein